MKEDESIAVITLIILAVVFGSFFLGIGVTEGDGAPADIIID